MKRLFFILVILSNALFGIQAQGEPEGYEYVPVVREGVEWGYRWYTGVRHKEGTYFLQLKGDTIIDGKTYKRCYEYNSWKLGGDAKIRGFMREENKRVYSIIVGQNGGQEQLIYDFNIGVGDSFNNEFMYEPVSKIEYVDIQGSYRKAFYYNEGHGDIRYLIEGMGMVCDEGEGGAYGSSGSLMFPQPHVMNGLFMQRNQLEFVGLLPLKDEFAQFEYERGVEMDAVAEVAADRKTLSVRQGDGWVEADLDGDCYRRATLADAQGRTVRSVEIAQGDAVATISTAGLVQGVYLFSLHAATGATITQKVSIAD